MLFCCLLRNVEASCDIVRRRLPPSTITTGYLQLLSYQLAMIRCNSVLHLLLQAFTARDEARYRRRISIST